MYSYKHIWLVAVLSGCSTIPRPDLGIMRNHGKEYEYIQRSFLGIKADPKPVQRQSKADAARQQIRKPATWLLWVLLPASMLSAIVAAVCVVWLQSPKLARLAGIAGLCMFGGALLASAWIMATASLYIFAPINIIMVATLVYYLYRLTKGTNPQQLRQLRQGNNGKSYTKQPEGLSEG